MTENDKMDGTDYEELAQELVDKIQHMVDDRDKKLAMAKEQLIGQLKVTAEKYRTATGVMEALRVLRMVNDGRLPNVSVFDEIDQAADVANLMSDEALKMADRAEGLGFAEMGELCDGAYDPDYTSEPIVPDGLCLELMRIDLCRNVGPAAEDIVGFLERSDEEMVETRFRLEDILEEHPELEDLKPSWFQED